MSLIHLCVTRPLTPPVEGTDLVIFSDIKNYVAQWDNQNFLSSCKKYAKRYGVYLLTSRVVADGYLCLFLFDDTGKVIGGQRAVSLNLSYRGAINRSTDLNIIRTKFGNLFLAVDVDIYRPEVIRAAALQGAEIILSSQFIPLYDYQSQKLCQLAYQAADNGVYIVNVNNASTSVISPVAASSCPDGFLLREDDSVPLFYSLDTGLYRKTNDPASPLSRLRPALYEKYASFLGR